MSKPSITEKLHRNTSRRLLKEVLEVFGGEGCPSKMLHPSKEGDLYQSSNEEGVLLNKIQDFLNKKVTY